MLNNRIISSFIPASYEGKDIAVKYTTSKYTN